MKHAQYYYLFSILTVFLLFISRPQTSIAQDVFFESHTTVGGYGELHYNLQDSEQNPATKKLDFHRFVLFYAHAWTEKWSLKAEVELEHNFVAEGQGELELEQALVNYHHSDAFGFQIGVLLPSVGILNEYHEPPVFLSVERPDYSKYIIPTTWFGNGASIFGKRNGFEYKFTVMEGLNGNGISNKSGIRSALQKGYKANAQELLYTGRLNYTAYPGVLAGFSYTTTNAMHSTAEDIPLSIFELHAQAQKKNLHATFEWANINYDRSELQQSQGYYFDLGYDFAHIFQLEGSIIPWFRISEYNTAAKTQSGGDSEKEQQYSKWLLGLTIKPISEVVFKFDYGVKKNALSQREVRLFNFGVGYMF